ncbi:C2H2-type domain-containing protein, partial [Trichostrongylus colubriformis]
MGYKVPWKPVNESWTTNELIKHLEVALSLCSATDVILAATGERDRFLPFTEYSVLQCDNCGAICNETNQFLVHILKCRFDEAHLMLYKRLGMVPRSVQHILDRKWERSSSMVGRALQNNPELCVLTPVQSPLAPFILSGVTVSTSEPKSKNTFAKTMVE